MKENRGPLGSNGLGSIELSRSHGFYIYFCQNKALQNTLQSNYTCEETKRKYFKELSEVSELPQTGMCKIWVSPERKEYSAIYDFIQTDSEDLVQREVRGHRKKSSPARVLPSNHLKEQSEKGPQYEHLWGYS